MAPELSSSTAPDLFPTHLGMGSRSSSVGPKFLPIVIPQTTKRLQGVSFSPFTRAYPTTLATIDQPISKSDLVSFIDDLNEAFIASPFLQAVGLAGTITSFVPLSIAQIVGGAVSLSADVGTAATSYGRTRAFVKAANEKVFGPRGLQLKILSTRDMMAAVGMKDQESLPLHGLPEFDEEWAINQEGSINDPRIRWLQALEGRISTLDWNVPGQIEQQSWLKKAGAWQAKRLEEKQTKDLQKQREKAGERAEKRREEMEEVDQDAAEKLAKIERKMSKVAAKSGKSESKKNEKISKLEDKMDKKQRKWEKQSNKVVEKREKDGRKADRQEHKVVQKIRWLVILPQAGNEAGTEQVDPGIEQVS